jgi:hypothetical protein
LASEQKFIAQLLFEEEEEDNDYFCPHCQKVESKVDLAVINLKHS